MVQYKALHLGYKKSSQSFYRCSNILRTPFPRIYAGLLLYRGHHSFIAVAGCLLLYTTIAFLLHVYILTLHRVFRVICKRNVPSAYFAASQLVYTIPKLYVLCYVYRPEMESPTSIMPVWACAMCTAHVCISLCVSSMMDARLHESHMYRFDRYRSSLSSSYDW